jgi:DNA-directed RNA polymerase specialized sigma subunit
MSVKEILEAIRSHEMDMDIKIGCVDDETLLKYQIIMRILSDSKLINGFKDDSYSVLAMFYLQGMKISDIAKEFGKKEDRHIYRLKNKGIEKLEAKLAKIAPPRSGS